MGDNTNIPKKSTSTQTPTCPKPTHMLNRFWNTMKEKIIRKALVYSNDRESYYLDASVMITLISVDV